MGLYLGIDTSNYTTSLAITDDEGNLIAENRKLLDVKPGTRGLRQSEAVFQHIKNFPLLLKAIFDKIDKSDLKAIGVSIKPRPLSSSYMPVFHVGKTFAETIAASLDIPVITTTHQEGHIMAGIWSCGEKLINQFITIHISGGTTEILKVNLETINPLRFSITKLGGSNDLHAGQFIDRIGVKMGLPFPAGPSLEQLATTSTDPYQFPVAVVGFDVSFSGPESHGQRLIEQGANFANIARGVEDCLVKSLEKLLTNVQTKTKEKYYLFVGGVASNTYLRNALTKKFNEQKGQFNLAFATPQHSSDNAVGVSIIAQSGIKGGCSDV